MIAGRRKVKTFRKTLKWIFLLLLAGTAAGGGYAYYFWNQSDEILRQALLDRLHQLAPGWNVSIGPARFDRSGRIHVYELSLKSGDGLSTLLHIPEGVLTVDREHLLDPHSPIQHVRWIRPTLVLERDAAGKWNWEQLPPLNLPKNVIPEFHADHAVVAVVFHDSPTGAAVRTTCDDVIVQLIPKAARHFLVRAKAKFPHSDGLSAEGTWQIDAGMFDLKGHVHSLQIDGALSQLAAEFSSDYRAGLARLKMRLDRLAAGPATTKPGAHPEVPASRAAAEGAAPDDVLNGLGLSAVADVQFRLTQWHLGAQREYKVTVDVLRGEMKSPPVPFPLQDLRGRIELENEQILVRDFTARSGVTHIALAQGRILERGELRPADFDFEIKGLPLDERVARLITPAMRRVYDDVRPTGEVDVRVHLDHNGRDGWEHDCDLVARNGTVTHKKFPYPIDQVEGTITQRGDLVKVAMQGRAGTQRVQLAGWVRNPGDEAASVFVVKTAGIPVDGRLRNACPEKYGKVIDQLRAQGELDGTVRFDRAAGRDKPVKISVNALFRNGSVNCMLFPWPLTQVSGEFRGSGDEWEFENFSGRHGPAEVACKGAFRRNREGTPELELNFSLLGAMFDRQLLAALPESVQNVWREFSPEGGLNIPVGKLFWAPGPAPCLRIARLDTEIIDGTLMLKSFPFSIVDVAARINYDGRQANIESFSGRHDETTIRVKGGFARYESDGEWCVHLQPMYVDDLEATPHFRGKLPEQLRKTVDALDPRGKQSISGMLEFRGMCGGGYPVTAAWDTVTVYSGTTINAGVDLRDIYGKAMFRGTWDGTDAVGEGRIELDSVKVLDHLLTDVKGPARIDGMRLVLGSPPPEGRPAPELPDPALRITARFIEGLLGLDAVVHLGEPMRYRVHMTLTNGELKRYAQLYLSPGNNKLAGKMNGKIDLRGEGVRANRLTGTGTLVISPAALYDLPVLVKVINALQLIPPDNKAFDQARFVFDIKDSTVHFGRIELDGDSMKLGGKGTVNFKGDVDLTFGSRLGRKQVPIPLVRDVVDGISRGAVGVKVSGTLRQPVAKILTFQQLDEALRRLFDARGMQQPRR
jgi:hypothetical protein